MVSVIIFQTEATIRIEALSTHVPPFSQDNAVRHSSVSVQLCRLEFERNVISLLKCEHYEHGNGRGTKVKEMKTL